MDAKARDRNLYRLLVDLKKKKVHLVVQHTYPIVVFAGILVKLVQCNLGIQLICMSLEKDKELHLLCTKHA